MYRFSGVARGFSVACGLTFVASGQPLAAASCDGWKVFQRPYGCGISRSGTGNLSPDPVFWRPFRGETTILLKIGTPKGQGASVGRADGFLELDQGLRLPVHVSWGSEIDPSKINWPSKKILSVKLEEGAERDFGNALVTARIGQIKSKEDRIAVPLPDPTAWRQAEGCLASVGSALLTSAPPPYSDGTRPNRSLPVPRGAGAWINSNAYPPKALATKTEGDVGIKVIVDRYGYPLECSVVKGSGSNILDDATCIQIMKVAHFYPALNGAGVPSDGKWETVIKWRVP